jgi:hypothetical protein
MISEQSMPPRSLDSYEKEKKKNRTSRQVLADRQLQRKIADRSGRQVVVLGKSDKVLWNPRNLSTGTSSGVESGLPGVFDVLSKPANAGRTMMCEQSIASRLLDGWKRSRTFIQVLHRSRYQQKIQRLQVWQKAALVHGMQA